MERLTLNEAIEHCYEKTDCSECGQQHAQLAKWLKELKQYSDAEEQGLLLRLPCKVGTKIYYIGSEINDEINEWEYFVSEYGFKPYMLEELGKRYFLTKEEAEAALAKMEEGV